MQVLTLTEKIKTGVLKRDVVESRLAHFEKLYVEKHNHWLTLEGFERDTYASRVLYPLNVQLDAGRVILKRMVELGY